MQLPRHKIAFSSFFYTPSIPIPSKLSIVITFELYNIDMSRLYDMSRSYDMSRLYDMSRQSYKTGLRITILISGTSMFAVVGEEYSYDQTYFKDIWPIDKIIYWLSVMIKPMLRIYIWSIEIINYWLSVMIKPMVRIYDPLI